MAAYLQSRGVASVVGKRFLNQITYSFRTVHGSVYDKNLEEHVRGTVVQDDVIDIRSDQYWAPHPQTGVFGPVTYHSSGDRGLHSSPASANSVLEQKTFFRPLEDLEKPPHA